MKEKQVYVTGMGIVSALGVGCEATLRALENREGGIAPVEHLSTDHSYLPVGEVKLTNTQLAAKLGVGAPYTQLRTVMLGVLAAREAIEMAKLTSNDLHETAFINGTTVGGMDKTEIHFKDVFDSQAQTPDAIELQYNDCGISTEMIVKQIGKVKMATTASTACSSAANATILGANLIKAGVVDIAIVGGTEGLTRFHLNGFNTLMILDKERCRPFDDTRAGINLGEGAAYMVIESEESMKKRGATPVAKLSGYANTCDAFHQTATSENGEGPYLAMRKAMDMARLSPKDIGYINAHGTGTPNNDITEFAAMERIWGCNLPTFSSTKSFTGHTTSASGSIESVMSILAMNKGFVPEGFGLENPISENIRTDINSGSEEIENFINNSFGFGGNDSTLIFSRTSRKEDGDE